MPHHLGNALNGNTCAKSHRAESVASHVERQSLPNATSLANDTQLDIYHATAAFTLKYKALAFFFHRLLFFVSCLRIPAMADDGFRYGMQWYDKLNLCLLTLLADIPLSIRCRLNMPIL